MLISKSVGANTRSTSTTWISILVPIMDKIHYEHSLKEVAYDVPPQECITKDNVSVEVDGIFIH